MGGFLFAMEIFFHYHTGMETFRKKFWKWLGPFFILLRDILLKLRIIHHHGRQEYHMGWLKPERNIVPFKLFLLANGFSDSAPAWIDEDEVIALRKLDGFRYQYHIRVYGDGEVKGHYEVTPEAGFWNHFLEWDMEPRREEFLNIIGDWIQAPEYRRSLNETPGLHSPTRARRRLSGLPRAGSGGDR